MRGPCEVCMDHEIIRPQHEYRVVKTEMGELGLRLCGPHSMALTRSIAAHVRRAMVDPEVSHAH